MKLRSNRSDEESPMLLNKLKLEHFNTDLDRFDDIEETLELGEAPQLFLQKVTSNEIIYRQRPADVKPVVPAGQPKLDKLNDSIAARLEATARPVDDKVVLEDAKQNNAERIEDRLPQPKLSLHGKTNKKYSFRKDSVFCRFVVTRKRGWLLWLLRKFTGWKHSYSCAENFIWNGLNTVMLYWVARPFMKIILNIAILILFNIW